LSLDYWVEPLMTDASARRGRLVFLLPVFLAVAAGCGGGKKQIPVKGKVTLGNTPLTSGSVTYHPDESKGTKVEATSIVGPINELGEYSLSAGNREGCPPGFYKVTVTASIPSDPKNPYSLPRSIINQKFNDPRTTPLSVEVKPDAPAGTYDLSVSK
jgi:hypothetical protein